MKRAILVILAIMLVIPLCNAADIGVSPALVGIEDVLRGGYAESQIFVTSSSPTGGFINATLEGNLSEWVRLDPNTPQFVSSENPAGYRIIAQPPSDIPNGLYKGKIKFTSTPNTTDDMSIQMASRVKVAINVVVGVSITDIESFSCRVRSFSVESVEKGQPLKFKAYIRNEGNVRMTPKLDIEIWDVDQRSIVKMINYEEGTILPTTGGMVEVEVETDDMDYGQYWAVIGSEDCGAAETLTFDVLEPGALVEQGVLEKIVNKVWSVTGENIQMDAIFKNTGQKKTVGQFRGRVSKGDVIYKELVSDEQLVEPGEAVNFTFFFKPKEPGRYVASGRVFYGKKRTFEGSSILNVREAKAKLPIGTILFYLVVVAVFFLAFKIRKEKKKKK